MSRISSILKIILSVRYSKDADFLRVRVGRSMVVLLVGGVGKCCGRPKCLGTCMK